ncbi:MAG: S9 family peptidase [Acidimicrobiia bacterium]|nr:S9 family peptidase [Acidimicrobiia bacterium]
MSSPITAPDLWSLRRVGQPRPLPDGSAAIVPVTTYDFTINKPTTLLYTVAAEGSTSQLTTKQASQPAVSPDGSRIAFARPVGDGPPQLHLIPIAGGEAQPLTDLPLGVGESKWLPDGSGLIVTAPLLQGHPSVDATEAELNEREGRHGSAVVTEDRVYRYWKRWLVGGRIHHLFHVDASTGAATDLTPGMERLLTTEAEPAGDFDVSPDGSQIAFSLEVELPGRPYFQFAIHTLPVRGGTPQQLMAELPAQQRRPRYSPDGASLLFGTQVEHAYYADRVRLTRYDFDSESAEVISEAWDRSAAGWEFTGPSSVVLYAEHEGRNRLFTTNLAGAPPELVGGDASWHGPLPAGSTVWCRTESASQPPEVGIIEGGVARTVSSFNDSALGAIELGATDTIGVTGAEDADIEVKLVFPPGFDPARKWPLLHNIHGGPHGLVNEDWHWRWNTQVMAAAGYVVASVNFHGSTSWGEDFTGAIRGAWGDRTYKDVMAATDALVATGYIDEDRMAVAGGSYGGYLVTWITTQTDRFKASICHAGVTELLGQWASDVTEGREKAVGGVPWENLRDIQRWSPLANTRDIVTPTLVIHGELDYRVVVTQGLVLYGILQHKGVPTRLVYFPDEGHWIESPANAMTWWEEFLGWLDRWV